MGASIRVKPYYGASNSEKIEVPSIGNTRVRDYRGNRRRIGITARNLVTRGQRITMTGTAAEDRSRPGSSSMKTLLQGLGYSMRNRDVDHVTDLAFGGRDRATNLWPLASSINRIASTNGNWYSTYRIEYKERQGSRKIRRERPIGQLRGKRFEIVGFRHQPRSPGGRTE